MSRVLDRTKPYRAADSGRGGVEKSQYESTGRNRQGLTNFEIRHKERDQAVRDAVEYAYIMRQRFLEDAGEIQLFCTDSRIVIYGRHLEPIWEMLRAHNLDYIEVFDDAQHEPPAEGETLITGVFIAALNAEPVPDSPASET